jgi:AcrR family transcriptional regulator
MKFYSSHSGQKKRPQTVSGGESATRATKNKSGADSKAVTKEDWLYTGLLQFAEGGERNVRVEKIARDLGVTKGSYYWYFESREGFLEKLLEHSLVVGTEEFIQRSEDSKGPREKLRLLIAAILKDRRGKDFDFYLRDFARRNKLAAKIIRKTEGRRIEYLRGLLTACGVHPDEARIRAEIFYNYYLGWYERNKDSTLSRKELARQIDWMARITGVNLLKDE